MELSLLGWGVLFYFIAGIAILFIGILDTIEQGYDPDFKWWHIIRAIFFCLFLAPGYMVWLILCEIVKRVMKK